MNMGGFELHIVHEKHESHEKMDKIFGTERPVITWCLTPKQALDSGKFVYRSSKLALNFYRLSSVFCNVLKQAADRVSSSLTIEFFRDFRVFRGHYIF